MTTVMRPDDSEFTSPLSPCDEVVEAIKSELNDGARKIEIERLKDEGFTIVSYGGKGEGHNGGQWIISDTTPPRHPQDPIILPPV